MVGSLHSFHFILFRLFRTEAFAPEEQLEYVGRYDFESDLSTNWTAVECDATRVEDAYMGDYSLLIANR